MTEREHTIERLRKLKESAASDQSLQKKLDFRTYVFCLCDILIEMLTDGK